MNGVELIAQERQRQIEKEGWTPEHDDEHDGNELAWMAVCYTAPGQVFRKSERQGGAIYFLDCFPETWSIQWDKREYDRLSDKPVDNFKLQPKDRIRNLVKAGALIAAEIDRLQRLQENPSKMG